MNPRLRSSLGFISFDHLDYNGIVFVVHMCLKYFAAISMI